MPDIQEAKCIEFTVQILPPYRFISVYALVYLNLFLQYIIPNIIYIMLIFYNQQSFTNTTINMIRISYKYQKSFIFTANIINTPVLIQIINIIINIRCLYFCLAGAYRDCEYKFTLECTNSKSQVNKLYITLNLAFKYTQILIYKVINSYLQHTL